MIYFYIWVYLLPASFFVETLVDLRQRLRVGFPSLFDGARRGAGTVEAVAAASATTTTTTASTVVVVVVGRRW